MQELSLSVEQVFVTVKMTGSTIALVQSWKRTDMFMLLTRGKDKTCSVCHKETIKVCPLCVVSSFCSKECQIKHWSSHKNDCDKLAEAKKLLHREYYL